MQGRGDSEAKEGKADADALCLSVDKVSGGKSWLAVSVGVRLCHKLRNELAQKGWN